MMGVKTLPPQRKTAFYRLEQFFIFFIFPLDIQNNRVY